MLLVRIVNRWNFGEEIKGSAAKSESPAKDPAKKPQKEEKHVLTKQELFDQKYGKPPAVVRVQTDKPIISAPLLKFDKEMKSTKKEAKDDDNAMFMKLNEPDQS